MNLIPYKRFVLKSDISSVEIARRLKMHTEGKMLWRQDDGSFPFNIFEPQPVYFEGYVNKYEFNIRRIITYGNSYLPVIEGQIIEKKGDTFIDLSFRLKESTVALLAITAIFLSFIIGILIYNAGFQVETFIFVMFIFSIPLLNYLLMILLFNKELKISKFKIEGIIRK